MPNDLFILLIITAMAAFSAVLGFVSITDREPRNPVQPAE